MGCRMIDVESVLRELTEMANTETDPGRAAKLHEQAKIVGNWLFQQGAEKL